MKMSAKGFSLLQTFEGLRLRAYTCTAGVWTIGYGDTGPDVVEGLEITLYEAQKRFQTKLVGFEKGVVLLLGRKTVVTQGQFDALVSFAYNLGLGALKTSTLLKYIKAGEILKAANEFPKWNKVKKGNSYEVEPGLVKRRSRERDLFLS